MEKTSTLVNNIFSNTKEYLNLKTKSLKLEAYEKTADAFVRSSSFEYELTRVAP